MSYTNCLTQWRHVSQTLVKWNDARRNVPLLELAGELILLLREPAGTPMLIWDDQSFSAFT
jgi:hypothetical protein